LRTKRAAYEVKSACEGPEGVVTRVAKRSFSRRPPPPLNLADLQKEAFRLFGYAPSRTLQIAERLYLGALISYPRTGSQRLPKVDYAGIISKIAAIPGYSGAAGDLLSRGPLHPTQGQNTDPAHPAIYPTGESARRSLGAEEAKVFDLVVRRFLSCFGEDAVYEGSYIGIAVGEQHEFTIDGTRVVAPGWLRFAAGGSRQADHGSVVSPDLREGDRVEVQEVAVAEHLRARPARYSQATLLEKMEKEGIGTNATRAGIISTLLDRHYVAGESLVPTELGLALIEAMRRHCPQIISTSLTRDIEAHLERIEGSPDLSWEFYEETLSSLLRQLGQVRSHEDEIGSKMRVSVSDGRMILGRCPMCKKGELWVVRSRKSGKRFVGCTNYSGGCTASAPLPQRGGIKVASKPCSSCGWPVVYVGIGRRRWKLCVNDRCPRKVNVYKMQKTQSRPTT
jgi:DNA topoisomerase I